MTLTCEQKSNIQIFLSCMDYLYRESVRTDLLPVSRIIAQSIHDLTDLMLMGEVSGTPESMASILDQDFFHIMNFFQALSASSSDDIRHFKKLVESEDALESPDSDELTTRRRNIQ